MVQYYFDFLLEFIFMWQTFLRKEIEGVVTEKIIMLYTGADLFEIGAWGLTMRNSLAFFLDL